MTIFLCKLGLKKQSVVLHTTFLQLFLLQSINVVFLVLKLGARTFGIPMFILAFIFICLSVYCMCLSIFS